MVEPEIRRPMLYVVRTCPMPLDHPANNGQVMYLGPDQRGVPLEVTAFEAMRLRPSYRAAYEEVTRWL